MVMGWLIHYAEQKKPKAKAARDANKVGTKRQDASDAGLGAGASAAAAFCMVETATSTTNNATKNFIFIASIALISQTKNHFLCF